MASQTTESSPTGSVSSADAALFEILGIDKLSLDRECEDEDDHYHEDDDKPSDDMDHNNSRRNANKAVPPSVVARIPPQHCHRPHTPHTPILLQSSPLLLSAAQCSYIIYNLGYRTTNNHHNNHNSNHNSNKDQTVGPTYITAAQHDGVTVPLLHPNHHKVCVFQSDVVIQWIQHAFHQSGIHTAIQEWCQTNGIHSDNHHHHDNDDDKGTSSTYRINPRLRLLRYDAINNDIFLPHYDATTTTTTTTSSKITTSAWGPYESKLTILLYLNTGNGINFQGGNTLFLNSFQPLDCMELVPTQGTLVVFNHELYHASQALTVQDTIQSQDGIRGGTKFVLRTDVMFPVVNGGIAPHPQQRRSEDDTSILVHQPVTTTSLPLTTHDVVTHFIKARTTQAPTQTQIPLNNDLHWDKLLDILHQLGMDQLPVTTFLVPGPIAVHAMLVDLGIDTTTAHEFIQHCQTMVY